VMTDVKHNTLKRAVLYNRNRIFITMKFNTGRKRGKWVRSDGEDSLVPPAAGGFGPHRFKREKKPPNMVFVDLVAELSESLLSVVQSFRDPSAAPSRSSGKLLILSKPYSFRATVPGPRRRSPTDICIPIGSPWFSVGGDGEA